MQRKAAAGHSPEAERALELAFRELRANEERREEEQREAIRRGGSSPLGKREPQFGGRQVYEELSKQATDQAQRERQDLQQFVCTLRDRSSASHPQ